MESTVVAKMLKGLNNSSPKKNEMKGKTDAHTQGTKKNVGLVLFFLVKRNEKSASLTHNACFVLFLFNNKIKSQRAVDLFASDGRCFIVLFRSISLISWITAHLCHLRGSLKCCLSYFAIRWNRTNSWNKRPSSEQNIIAPETPNRKKDSKSVDNKVEYKSDTSFHRSRRL